MRDNRPFLFGQIIHPELDGTRCIPCFKVHWRDVTTRAAAVFRAACGTVSDDERAHRQASMASIVAAAYAPPDPKALTMEQSVASLGDPFERMRDMDEQEADAIFAGAQGMFEALQRGPDMPADCASPVEIALAAIGEISDADVIGACHVCGRKTANPDRIGGQCLANKCRGYMHPVEETLREGYFKA